MQAIPLPKEQLIRQLNFAPNWEIREPNFGKVLATSDNGQSIEDSLNELQSEFAGLSLSIKAGMKDKNGKFAFNTKTFSFTLPADSQENYMIDLVSANQQTTLFGIGNSRNQQTPTNNIYELIIQEKIKGLEGVLSSSLEKQNAEFEKQIAQIRSEYRERELDFREQIIEEKEEDLARRKDEFEALEQERIDKLLPSSQRAFKALFDMVFSFGANPQKKTKALGETQQEEIPQSEDIENDISEVEETSTVNLKGMVNQLSLEQKELLLAKLSESIDFDDDTGIEENEEIENETIELTKNKDNGDENNEIAN